MNGKGYIKVPRELLQEWRDILTLEEQGILINLMAMANYDEQPQRAPKGDYLHRGQLVTSTRSFAERFGISASKARRLMIKWEKLGIIKRETVFDTESGTQSGTLLTLEFYASSQGERNTKRNKNRNEKPQPIRNIKESSSAPALNDPGSEAEESNGRQIDAACSVPTGIRYIQP